jgi:hypothetical protein
MFFGKKIKSSVIRDGVYKYNDVYLKYIQVIRTFRECLPTLSNVPHVNQTGVYILFGINDIGQMIVYVGKGTDALARINKHKDDNDKDFFTEVFIITTNDNSFGDSHISYLENMIYNRFRISPNIKVSNEVVPSKGNLNEDEAEDCENFGDTIINIIAQAASGRFLVTQFGKSEHSKFFLKGIKGCELIATYTEGKLIVHKDSKVSRTLSNGAAAYVKRGRDELIEQGVFIEYKDVLILGQDKTFDNVNNATNILTGTTVSKSTELWKNYNGTTLKEYIDNGSDISGTA